MGNVKSFCCRDTGDDIDEDERTRILNENYASTNDYRHNSITSNHDSLSYGSCGNSHQSKERSVLDRIYQRMASNVIDVAPGESMVIQPAEFLERQKAYQSKLSQIKTPLPLKLSAKNNRIAMQFNSSAETKYSSADPSAVGAKALLGLNANQSTNSGNISTGSSNFIATESQHFNREKRRVEFEPIPVDEVQLMNEISEKTYQAFAGLKITSNERVVTQFEP